MGVYSWWWSMTEEFRIAAGFTMPTALLKRSLERQPETMFHEQLQRADANMAILHTALKGYVCVFAELRAVAVRKSIEASYSQPGTQTTSQSEATSVANDADSVSACAEDTEEVCALD